MFPGEVNAFDKGNSLLNRQESQQAIYYSEVSIVNYFVTSVHTALVYLALFISLA